MTRHTYRVEIAYDGTAFAGYQRQPGLQTVESALRDAVGPIVAGSMRLNVGGRTDRGVHATGQVISFTSDRPLALPLVREKIDGAHSGRLVATDVRPVPRWFHAGFSATLRRYVYLLAGDVETDAARVDRMLAGLTGRRCFTAFARDTPANRPTVRTLFEARARAVRHDGRPAIRFDFAADGFLRRQIRVVVATARRQARQGANDDALVELAKRQDRRATEPAADANGLYLVKVGYAAFEPRARSSRR